MRAAGHGLRELGFRRSRWQASLATGIAFFCSVRFGVTFVFAALLTALSPLGGTWEFVDLLVLLPFLTIYVSCGSRRGRRFAQATFGLAIYGWAFVLLLWFAVIPFERATVELAWIVLASAAGEELFFRGYVQTSWNRVFGRPWQLGKTRFGPGLFLTSALFGLVHLLNPWDYFHGAGSLAWFAAWTSFASLHLGFLRERTGGGSGADYSACSRQPSPSRRRYLAERSRRWSLAACRESIRPQSAN